MSYHENKETILKKDPFLRIQKVALYLFLIIVSFYLSYSLHNIFLTFKPALAGYRVGYIFNVVWLELPALILLVLILVLSFLCIKELVFLCITLIHGIRSYKQAKLTDEYNNARTYLTDTLKDNFFKKFKINKSLFILHIRDRLKLFAEGTQISDFHLTKSLVEKSIDKITDFNSHGYTVIINVGGYYLIGFFLNCFFVNNILNNSYINKINIINLIILAITIGLFFLLYKSFPRIIQNRNLIKSFYMKRKYPYAYNYIYYNNLYCPAPQSEIQALDYWCQRNSCPVKVNTNLLFTRYKTMTLDEYKKSEYYKKNEISQSIHPDSKMYKSNKRVAKQFWYFASSLSLVALIIMSIIIPFKLYQSDYKLRNKVVQDDFKSAMGLYQKELQIAKNAPDSVVVKAYSDMIDYNSIGNDWYLNDSFNKEQINDSICFALSDLENKNIKINSTIVEEDETFPDRSFKSINIKFNKKDLLANDSTLIWSFDQLVKENGKRSTSRYAVWEKTYKVRLKPKNLPEKPIKDFIDNINVDGEVLAEELLNSSTELPTLQTSIDEFQQITNNFISVFK